MWRRRGGGDAVFDLTGRWIPRLQAPTPRADRVARELMDRAPGTDWTGWLVDVHDARGRRVSMRSFAHAGSGRRG
ncbi:DUF6894 family protein [Methylorubrum rhodinum]|uniref:DUF6894 family protein n=1 Tax=Methylorubrum rhodinum TaxID=29428 RepID=UPI0035E458F7